MSQALILIFTGVIAASTLVYTFYSIRLWRATRSSADIARFTAFMSLLTQLMKYQLRPSAVFFAATHYRDQRPPFSTNVRTILKMSMQVRESMQQVERMGKS